MGIFEKSIPKYVVNPIDRTVEVAPQDVYVDDIFDPIFNANVRNAMRQKYGDGLYGITGGYGELLQNTWGGGKGLFGKGMGVLSTFGRSMEKADDLVLGLLTEGVEGLSGQGFDNPLQQIFVEDEDYTGKRFLASTANIFRNLAGGTTITEQDLGTAWNIPALGVELGTDVGILGGGLSRKLAPAARDFTSKELFQRLGKSDVKTTVGEIGQLMSNYDDLMAKVAIDITAPGLRPAFKKLGNKLAQYVATHSPNEYFDIELIKRYPRARKVVKEWLDSQPVAQMIDNVNTQTSKIPTNAYEEAQFWGDFDELEWYNFVKQAVDTGDFTKLNDEFRKYSSQRGAEISSKYNDINSKYAKGFDEMLDRLRSKGINITQVGTSQQSDDLFDLVNDRGNDIDFLYTLRNNGVSVDDLRALRDTYSHKFYTTGSSAALKASDNLDGAILAAQRASEALHEVRKIITDATPGINATYVEEVLEKLESDDTLLDALRSGEWTTNEAANRAVESLLKNPSYQASLWYSTANPKFRISPSRFIKLNTFGVEGTSLARARLELPRHFLGDPDKPRFSNVEELDKFLKTPKVEIAIKDLFPSTVLKERKVNWEHPLVREAITNPENAVKLQGQVPIVKSVDGVYTIVWRSRHKAPEYSIDKVRQLIKDVYYPSEELNIQKYTARLEELSKLLSESKFALPNAKNISKHTPAETNFFEELYKAFDEVDDISGEAYGINQLYLQKVRDEMASSIGSQKFDIGKDLRDDFSTSFTEYVREVLSQAAPKIKTDEDLTYVLEPILDFVQVVPGQSLGKLDEIRRYLSNTTGIAADRLPHHLVSEQLAKGRLAPSERTLTTVANFKTNVYPKIKAYTSKWGSYYGHKPKNAEWKDYYEVRYLLGFKDDAAYTSRYGIPKDVLPEGYANRQMFEAIAHPESGSLKVKDFSKSEVNLLLEDTAMGATLSRKHVNPELKLEDEVSEIFNRYRHEKTTTASAKETAEAVKSTIANQSPETVAKQAYSTHSTASATAEETVNKMSGEMNDFANKGGSDSAGRTIYGERKWRWFKIIKDALSVSANNARRGQRATLRTTRATELAERFRSITSRLVENGKSKDFKRFYILRQKQLGDVVSGKDFWTTFRRTGILVAPYEYGSKQVSETLKTLTKNADLINEAAGKPIVEVITKDIGNGTAVVMRFTGNLNTVKYVKKASKKLDTLSYSDVVFSPPKTLTKPEIDFMDSSDMRELSGLMTELQNLSNEQAKLLGFNFDNSIPYTHHTMYRSDETAEWLGTTFYDKLSAEEYDEISKLISNFDEYRKTDRGAFGTMIQDRSFRGDYWLLDSEKRIIFEYSPNRIFTSTLADGMFANLQYQDFTDLFINDNFKIKGWFNTVEDLKKVLYATDSKGRLSGNFANSELVSFRLDENGKISGLVKYDKTTDAGLVKALADKNTILVPANAISHMDNILRKDVRMNNKFWTFINKHFTIPFKFGLLSNPGFLAGNVSDATLKLATTMSEKYGTTLTKELANVTECINASQVLKNNYYEAFDTWKKVSAEYGIKLSPEATVADIVAMSPKHKEQFLNWLNGDLEVPYKFTDSTGNLRTEYREVPCELSKDVVDNASIWTMLQGIQMSSEKMREYADLADVTSKSDFDVATNMFDRITQGSGKYNWKKPSTWGLFMNNPYMKTLTDASGAWEDVIRTASILDDLRHGQYSKEDFAKFARGSKGTEDSILYRVRLDEAKNTMFNAQFDYERQSDFISKIGKAVPFPIFFLKNFAYWMELFDKNPQFVDNVIDIQEGLWSGYNEEGDKFMTEAKGRGAIPVGGKALPEWFKGVYKPSPLQSMFGAFNLLNDPIDNLTYRVNPLISGASTAAAEVLPDNELTTLLQDPESVKYRPYSTDMYERNVKQGDPNFDPVKYTLHRMNPYERLINTKLRVPEKIREGEYQLSDTLPSVFQPMF